jgi:hypothetical protein
MTAQSPPPLGPRKVASLFHLIMVLGPLATGAAFGFVIFMQGPLLRVAPPVGIAWGLPAVALVVVLFALFVTKGQVPRPTAGQTPDAYWGDVTTLARVRLFWILLEGPAIISLVGSLLTGSPAAMAMVVVAFALIVIHSPGHFEAR